jgi:hypothetical protein
VPRGLSKVNTDTLGTARASDRAEGFRDDRGPFGAPPATAADVASRSPPRSHREEATASSWFVVHNLDPSASGTQFRNSPEWNDVCARSAPPAPNGSRQILRLAQADDVQLPLSSVGEDSDSPANVGDDGALSLFEQHQAHEWKPAELELQRDCLAQIMQHEAECAFLKERHTTIDKLIQSAIIPSPPSPCESGATDSNVAASVFLEAAVARLTRENEQLRVQIEMDEQLQRVGVQSDEGAGFAGSRELEMGRDLAVDASPKFLAVQMFVQTAVTFPPPVTAKQVYVAPEHGMLTA